jgi:hypothetical protein
MNFQSAVRILCSPIGALFVVFWMSPTISAFHPKDGRTWYEEFWRTAGITFLIFLGSAIAIALLEWFFEWESRQPPGRLSDEWT